MRNRITVMILLVYVFDMRAETGSRSFASDPVQRGWSWRPRGVARANRGFEATTIRAKPADWEADWEAD